MNLLQDRPPVRPEVLIEEARERQRRRRRIAGTALLAAVIAAGVVGLWVGGGSSPGSKPGGGHGAPGASPAAAWHELSAPDGYIRPVQSTVTSVVRWHGEFYATGQLDANGRLSGLGCSVGCGPVVWASRNGRHWRAVYAHTPYGSGDGESFVATDHQLLLVDSDMFVHTWRSSNGRAWREQKLSSAISGGLGASGEATADSMPVSVPSRYLVDGHLLSDFLNPAVASTYRLHWPRSLKAGQLKFLSISALPRGGYVALAEAWKTWRLAVLTSANGSDWHVSSPPSPRNYTVGLTVGRRGVVLELIPPLSRAHARDQLWQSADGGRTWIRATLPGELPLSSAQRFGPTPRLLATPDGFLLWLNTNTDLWWSATGRVWTRLRVSGAPPNFFTPESEYFPGAASLDGDSLIVAEQTTRAADGYPKYATTLWRLELPHR